MFSLKMAFLEDENLKLKDQLKKALDEIK